jgi:glycosyltransferase involved in cell wall biosynthesis
MRQFNDMTYSIVIPAYNESQRLGATLDKVLAYVRAQRWDAEVIVVNDGSRDNTAEIVRAFAAKDPMVRLVENPGNRGKGYSVRNGILSSRGDIVVFSDADLSSPIEEMPKLLEALARERILRLDRAGCAPNCKRKGNRCTVRSSEESSTCSCERF